MHGERTTSEEENMKVRFLMPTHLIPHIQLKVNSERVFMGLPEQVKRETFKNDSPFEHFYDRPNCLVKTDKDYIVTTNCWLPSELLSKSNSSKTFVDVCPPDIPKYQCPLASDDPAHWLFSEKTAKHFGFYPPTCPKDLQEVLEGSHMMTEADVKMVEARENFEFENPEWKYHPIGLENKSNRSCPLNAMVRFLTTGSALNDFVMSAMSELKKVTRNLLNTETIAETPLLVSYVYTLKELRDTCNLKDSLRRSISTEVMRTAFQFSTRGETSILSTNDFEDCSAYLQHFFDKIHHEIVKIRGSNFGYHNKDVISKMFRNVSMVTNSCSIHSYSKQERIEHTNAPWFQMLNLPFDFTKDMLGSMTYNRHSIEEMRDNPKIHLYDFIELCNDDAGGYFEDDHRCCNVSQSEYKNQFPHKVKMPCKPRKKTTYEYQSRYLVFSIIRYAQEVSNKKLTKPLRNFRVTVPSELPIWADGNKTKYKFVSAICYEGTDSERGHYYNLLTSGNHFIKCSDEGTQSIDQEAFNDLLQTSSVLVLYERMTNQGHIIMTGNDGNSSQLDSMKQEGVFTDSKSSEIEFQEHNTDSMKLENCFEYPLLNMLNANCKNINAVESHKMTTRYGAMKRSAAPTERESEKGLKQRKLYDSSSSTNKVSDHGDFVDLYNEDSSNDDSDEETNFDHIDINIFSDDEQNDGIGIPIILGEHQYLIPFHDGEKWSIEDQPCLYCSQYTSNVLAATTHVCRSCFKNPAYESKKLKEKAISTEFNLKRQCSSCGEVVKTDNEAYHLIGNFMVCASCVAQTKCKCFLCTGYFGEKLNNVKKSIFDKSPPKNDKSIMERDLTTDEAEIFKDLLVDKQFSIKVVGQHNGMCLMKKDVSDTMRILQNEKQGSLDTTKWYMTEGFMKYYLSMLNVNREDPSFSAHYCSGNITLIECLKQVTIIEGMTHLFVNQYNGKFYIVFKISFDDNDTIHVSFFDPLNTSKKGTSVLKRLKAAFEADGNFNTNWNLSLDNNNKYGDKIRDANQVRKFLKWHNGVFVCIYVLNSLYNLNLTIEEDNLTKCYYQIILSTLTGIQVYH